MCFLISHDDGDRNGFQSHVLVQYNQSEAMDSFKYVINLVINHDPVSLDTADKGAWSHLLFPAGSFGEQ
jgi:hypothetical protein